MKKGNKGKYGAQTKTILDYEKKQAETNRISDNKSVYEAGVTYGEAHAGHGKFITGMITGAVLVWIAAFIWM